MSHIVFLNGPSGSGKDTVARELTPYLEFRHLKFASPLKRAAAGLLDIELRSVEDFKDKPVSLLNEATLRTHLIDYFDFLAGAYGSDILGRILWKEIQNSARPLIVVSDSGKEEEVSYVVRRAGAKNCLVLRIHRKGYGFEGDNRQYLTEQVCPSRDVWNDSTKEQVTMFALHCIQRHFPDTKLLREPLSLRST
jgi:hypothetical protein